jgi:hypothetical protein
MELSEAEKRLFGGAQSMGDRVPNFRHGKYLLMVDTWKLHRGYRGVLSDVHNFVVLKADAITIVTDKETKEIPNEVGTKVGATFKYDGAGAEMAPINSTRFMLGLWGFADADLNQDSKTAVWLRSTNEDPAKFTGEKDEQTGYIIPPTNPMRGMLIGLETSPIFTKKTQRWITGLNWIHIARPGEGDNSYEAAAKRWAEYEAKFRA